MQEKSDSNDHAAFQGNMLSGFGVLALGLRPWPRRGKALNPHEAPHVSTVLQSQLETRACKLKRVCQSTWVRGLGCRASNLVWDAMSEGKVHVFEELIPRQGS